MVRVAGLKGMVAAGVEDISDDGRTPEQQLADVEARATELMNEQQSAWAFLQGELRANGIAVVDAGDLTDAERAWIEERFMAEIFPVLTPLAIDPRIRFPSFPIWASRSRCN